MHRWWWLSVSAVTVMLCSCVTAHLHFVRGQLDSSSVQRINTMLANADVELRLRGSIQDAPTLRGRTTFVLVPRSVLAIGAHDTVVIPIEYVAELRGTHRRSTTRLVIGGVGGLLVGSALGMVVAPAAPFSVGIAGAVAGLTVGALVSQQFVIQFDDSPK